ncbi:hypothetical protein DRJ53_07115 [Paracnuella aquatica]|nr:hypothetical protein DRJ53_07115 [Paracnuella aquatica]
MRVVFLYSIITLVRLEKVGAAMRRLHIKICDRGFGCCLHIGSFSDAFVALPAAAKMDTAKNR